MSEQSPDKDQLLDAVLPHVMFDGWSDMSVNLALKDLETDRATFDRIYPGGVRDLLTYFIKGADDQMEEMLIQKGALSMKIRDRITLAVRLRLEIYAPYKDAIRKALTFLAMPQNALLGTKLTAGTVSRMWYATGDKSVDFNYYTKRLTLSAVYASTLLYWLDDNSDDYARTWAFLDRRIENVMQFETAKFKAKKMMGQKPDVSFMPSPGRFFRNLKTRL